MTRLTNPALILASILIAAMLPLAHAAKPHQGAVPPGRDCNIIFIFVDDQGYYDLGCYGATEVDTPRIDAMASEGVRFTDYYAAAPICSPSRAGLLTGCYPRRVGLATWVQRADSNLGIHPSELTLPELLKAKGYATACIGKWHLGFHEPFLPRQQGFDHYFGLLHNLDPVEVVYFEDKGGVPLIRNGKVVKRPADPAELTRLYTDEAIQFIRKHAKPKTTEANCARGASGSSPAEAGLAASHPFFVYLPHTMLHNPLGVGDKFKGTSRWGEYGDAIQELDHHVGRIFDTLTELGVDDETLVIYASDNGRGPGRNPDQPLQGRKLSTWEGGIRVPAIAWGPGLGVRAGHESAQVVHAMDWYPTLATFAGIKVPAGRVIDGRDLTPLLTGKTDAIPNRTADESLNASVPFRRPWNPPAEWADLIPRKDYLDAFFYHGSQGALAAVRWSQWKLYLNPSLTLYDLESDPGETKPVRNGEITRKLRGMAILFQDEMRRHARPAGEISPPSPDQPPRKTVVAPEILLQLQSYPALTYARYDDGKRALNLDLYRPRGADAPLPAIVCIHGGGWYKGDRTSHGPLAMALAARGFVTATISYRLSGEAPFPAQIHDCKAAVRWLRANADEYGIDPDNIGAIGLSAGGHLTALLATSGGVPSLEGNGGNPDFSSAIQAAIPMGAQTDLESDRTRTISSAADRGKIWRQFLGGSLDEKPDTYQTASPLHHLDPTDPPLAFITGETDDPSTQADRMRQEMTKLGLPAHLKIIPEAPHPFLNRQSWFDLCIDYAASFFTVHLKQTAQ